MILEPRPRIVRVTHNAGDMLFQVHVFAHEVMQEYA